jgi:hypothetical protein
MKTKVKKWYWLGFNKTYTAIGNTIYCPPGCEPSQEIIKHEMVHMNQQKRVGLFLFIFLYLFCLPVLWNPWRKKWETEAYKANGLGPRDIKNKLKTSTYGWIW